MVNINLNQEEKFAEPATKEFNEDTFSGGINMETRDFSEDRSQFQPGYPEFGGKSNNSKWYMAAGALIVVLAVIFWVLLPSGDDNLDDGLDGFDQQSSSDPLLSDNSGSIDNLGEGSDADSDFSFSTSTDDADAPIETEPVIETSTPLGSLSPLEQEMKLSFALGSSSITGIMNALTGNTGFTLVRFTNNAFMAELISDSAGDLDQNVDDVRRNTGSMDVSIVSQKDESFSGRSYVKALISGKVSVDTSPVQIGGSVRNTSLAEYVQWLRDSAGSNQLAIKGLIQSDKTFERGFDATPIRVTLQGNAANTTSFLEALQGYSGSVIVDKLLLINHNLIATDNNSISLVMVLKHFSI